MSSSQLVSELKEEMRATVATNAVATIAAAAVVKQEQPPASLPPAAAAAAVLTPAATAPIVNSDRLSLNPSTTLEQRQLAEFNQWLYRWNNYQQHLAHYWQGRAHALYQQPTVDHVGGGGKVKNKKGKKKVEDKVELKWNMRFQELVDFKEEHGHCNVPKEFSYKFSPPLGHWVGRMRHLHKTGRLEPSRSKRLQEVGFEFVITKTDNIKFSVVWEKSFLALQAFRDANGHVEVPKGYRPTPDASELDGWIFRQRKHFKAGKLTDPMKKKLQGLGLNLGGKGRPLGFESEESWGGHVQALTKYCKENGDCDVPEKYSKDKELGIWAKTQRDAYTDKLLPDDRVMMLNDIGFNFYHKRKSVRAKTTDPWLRRLAELKAYKKKAGNTNVPKNFTLNFGLADFVFNQRMAHKDNQLTEDRVQALDDLGFEWTLQPKKCKGTITVWEKKFQELEDFKSTYGNLNVPEDYEPDPKLGGWAKRQRKNQREGVMKSEKYDRLKALGFDFGGPKQDKKPWMRQYECLVEFNETFGHIDVPVHYEKNPALYYWLGTQRQANKKGKLPDDKVALLDELNFDFSYKARPRTVGAATRTGKPFMDDEEWDRMFQQLEEFKEEHGSCDVPQRSGRLGSWVHYMRFYQKGGKVSQDKVDRLNEIGFCWNVTNDKWMSKYEDVCNYKTEHGNFDIPASHFLYNWVSYQRKLYEDDSLSQDRAELLLKIDFDFEMPLKKKRGVKAPEAWTLRYEDLVAFKDEYGHCIVPPTYGRNPALAKWVASQRTKNNKGNMREDRLDLLHEIGFDFTPQDPLQKLGVLKIPQLEPVSRETYLENMWDKSYEQLQAYKDHFGHCNIPLSYEANPALGAWAFSQRMAYKKDKLSEDRFGKLNELGFSFGPQKKALKLEEV